MAAAGFCVCVHVCVCVLLLLFYLCVHVSSSEGVFCYDGICQVEDAVALIRNGVVDRFLSNVSSHLHSRCVFIRSELVVTS